MSESIRAEFTLDDAGEVAEALRRRADEILRDSARATQSVSAMWGKEERWPRELAEIIALGAERAEYDRQDLLSYAVGLERLILDAREDSHVDATA